MSGRKAKEARRQAREGASKRFVEHNDVHNMAEFDTLKCEGWDIVEWHPLPNAEGRPTQVHILISPPAALELPELRFAMRLKSKEACDEFIGVLQKHRNHVWGDT